MAENRRRRVLHRALPVAALAAVAFAAGTMAGAGHDSGAEAASARFARAWTRQDFAAMHAELSTDSARRYSIAQLRRAYQEAYATATTVTVRTGRPRTAGRIEGTERIALPVEEQTRVFGRVRGQVLLPVEGERLVWDESLLFPGLRPGERLDRETEAPPRASILARDGTPLARGPAGNRTSALGTAALDVTGRVGSPTAAGAVLLRQEGFPSDAAIGASGLERAFQKRLAGRPGGRLFAVSGGSSGERSGGVRELARARPRRSRPLRTNIDPELQQAAVAALAGRLGGIVVLDARSGAIRALAGAAYSAPQPPGSTFKVVTLAAALEFGVVKPGESFPVERSATVGGREIENAHKAACGGTLLQSFAESCNSVFAPIGVRVGAKRLVEMAERFGFNQRPQVLGPNADPASAPALSSIPRRIDSELDLGVSAIGQGRLLATPLELASIAQTVAAAGLRSATPILREHEGGDDSTRAISRRTAAEVRKMMVAVVATGTGRAAAIPGIQVAGKTGTAELGERPREGRVVGELEEQPTDAWFAAFAPARRPKLAIAVMLIRANADGGEVAAPAARQVLAAGLQG